MLDPAAVAALLATHVLADGERVDDVRPVDDDVVVVRTGRRRFTVRDERDDWLIARHDWVDALVVATHEDRNARGRPERFAFLVSGADTIFVNDPAAIARLGSQVGGDSDVELAPVSYAELLVHLHLYTSATRDLLPERDDLRRVVGRSTLPDVAPLRIESTPDGRTLTFTSCVRYRRPGGPALVDVVAWTVHLPDDGPATWATEYTARALPLADSA